MVSPQPQILARRWTAHFVWPYAGWFRRKNSASLLTPPSFVSRRPDTTSGNNNSLARTRLHALGPRSSVHFDRYATGTTRVSHTPLSEREKVYPSAYICAAATMSINGGPWRAPTRVAVATSVLRCTACLVLGVNPSFEILAQLLQAVRSCKAGSGRPRWTSRRHQRCANSRHTSRRRDEGLQRAQDCIEPLQKHHVRLPAPTHRINLVCHEMRHRPTVFGLALPSGARI